ncbi:uncharacterized protein DUF4157 [Krasilnikovia cinnamomea]|uniref:Uncharacterized protein DUF4157 n=1 Tax=Krasilnikovia cinnamomea TaxID=349313 RepID=A0A4Q7ZEU2_9ACTN|nr:DUF4157 domain-containing protein [Krasilnikovia cinnamomea]RZU48643.1 uncharacterized protein DUF4157 [Krasilnikovia cinnamomea]
MRARLEPRRDADEAIVPVAHPTRPSPRPGRLSPDQLPPDRFSLETALVAGNAAIHRLVRDTTVPPHQDRSEPADAFALATSGQAGSVPYRARMEAAFGQDFGHVDAYLGGERARAGLAALGAHAATYGNRIAFADPHPAPGVVAHELAHVLQHDGASLPERPSGVSSPGDATERAATERAAAERAATGRSVGAAPALIHRLVATAGGSWTTSAYRPVNQPGRIGAHIELHFTANDLVEATQIGLSQSVRTLSATARGGAVDTPSNARTMPDFLQRGEGDVGRGIDRRDFGRGGTIPNTNPLYGVYNVAPAGAAPAVVSAALGDVAASGGNNATGVHRRKPDGTFFPAVDAVLDDTPGRTPAFAGQQWEQSFEVAALAIDGPLAGMYLGSVAWGWRTDDAGRAKLDPAAITLVRQGPPTEAFGDAAVKWNALTFTDPTTGTVYNTVDLPIAHDIDMFDTVNLARRLVELRAEVARLPAGPDRVRRDFTRLAYERELAHRNVEVWVKVRGTEDWTGADEVYVRVSGQKKHRTKAKKLNDGDSHDFLVPLEAFTTTLPLASEVLIEVFDEDTPDADDKIVSMRWSPAMGPVKNKASMDDANYDVRVGYER